MGPFAGSLTSLQSSPSAATPLKRQAQVLQLSIHIPNGVLSQESLLSNSLPGFCLRWEDAACAGMPEAGCGPHLL